MKNEMKIYEIIPLKSIGPVKLGMKREEVRKIFNNDFSEFKKTVDSKNTTDAFINSDFQVFYTEDDNVEFIELSGYCSKNFVVYFKNINIFKTPAGEIIEEISKTTPYDETDWEIPFSYTFPDIGICFWRSGIPEEGDTIKPIEEMDEYGNGFYFQTVGLGRKEYYSKNE